MAIISISFEYKTKIIGRTLANNNRLNTEIVVPLKYLSNFWRLLDLPLMYCEIELDLSWSEDCTISEISRGYEVERANLMAATETTGAIFQINSAKRYVLVFIHTNDNIKFLENIKQGFKRTISWDKYRSEITTQTKKQ